MLVSTYIFLVIVMFLSLLGTIGEETMRLKQLYGSITIVSIIAIVALVAFSKN